MKKGRSALAQKSLGKLETLPSGEPSKAPSQAQAGGHFGSSFQAPDSNKVGVANEKTLATNAGDAGRNRVDKRLITIFAAERVPASA
jgi:hypothetical protein